MRAIIQRVSGASVTVGERTVGGIQQGLCVLLGIAATDVQEDADYILKKLLQIRLFPSVDGKAWVRNVMEMDGGVLLVSQFTLCHVLKGNKPDFHNAMKTGDAQAMFDRIVASAKSAYKAERISTGEFGAYMQLGIQNDGPVTITLDSREGRNGGGASPAATPSTPSVPPDSD